MYVLGLASALFIHVWFRSANDFRIPTAFFLLTIAH